MLGGCALFLAACSSFSSGKPVPHMTTHPLGVTLSAIERFFAQHGAPVSSWAQGPIDSVSGPLDGMGSYTGGAGLLKIDVIGSPADETELSVSYTIADAADSKDANALMLAVVRRFAPGAVAWITGGVEADDGANGYFAGAGASDTSGQVALSFSTAGTKPDGLDLVLAGGAIPAQ